MMLAALAASPRALAMGLPFSRVISCASSSAYASSRSARRIINRPRRAGVSRRQGPSKAARAAATAASTSVSEASATSQSTCSVAGFSTAKACPRAASCQEPPMNRRRGVLRNSRTAGNSSISLMVLQLHFDQAGGSRGNGTRQGLLQFGIAAHAAGLTGEPIPELSVSPGMDPQMLFSAKNMALPMVEFARQPGDRSPFLEFIPISSAIGPLTITDGPTIPNVVLPSPRLYSGSAIASKAVTTMGKYSGLHPAMTAL